MPVNSIFSEERLYNYVNDLCFPRLAGTESEEKAVKITIDKFSKIGFTKDEINREPFQFSNFYSTLLIRLISMINLIFLLTIVLLIYIQLYASLLIFSGLFIITLLIIRALKNPESPKIWGKYYGQMFNATNVYVKIPGKEINNKKMGDIIISAHLDTKSQSFKTKWRIVIYRIWFFNGIILIIFYFLFLLMAFGNIKINIRLLEIGIWSPTIIISIMNLLLISLNTHNKSPGALDNATGMAIVFELSSYFLKNPLNSYNLWFCQFSAEELGTMGSRVFLNTHEREINKYKIFQINLDMISCKNHRHNRIEYRKSYGLFPRKIIAPVLNNYFEQNAKENQIKIHGFHLTTGAHTDTIPFHLRDYEAIDIVTRAAAMWSHTKKDTIDKIDSKVLKDGCILAKNVILNLDTHVSIKKKHYSDNN
ncbi:MAG: M28 family peptidase [Candidatus Lokiarchaeota archaeon]|nr:M28 family peptidase [Candidatus Lokiarchaeota archaeon]